MSANKMLFLGVRVNSGLQPPRLRPYPTAARRHNFYHRRPHPALAQRQVPRPHSGAGCTLRPKSLPPPHAATSGTLCGRAPTALAAAQPQQPRAHTHPLGGEKCSVCDCNATMYLTGSADARTPRLTPITPDLIKKI